MRKLGVILGGIVFVIAGIFVLVTGNAKIKRCTEEAVGKVIGIKEEVSTDSDGAVTYTYYPTIEYKVGERTIAKQSESGSGSFKYNINDSVDILYNPDNIEEYIFKGDKGSNIIGIVFIVLGTIVFVCGIIRRF